MAVTDEEFAAAERRMAALREAGRAVAARYDRRRGHLVVELYTGVTVTVPARLLEGLAEAEPRSLAVIEISPSGLGLHWPSLDADVYVPALLSGVFGSTAWMDRLGTGRSRSDALADVSGRVAP